jgi:hypothetical protein
MKFTKNININYLKPLKASWGWKFLFIILIIIFNPLLASAKIEQNIYNIEGIEINTSATTPSQARDLAIAQAQRSGFLTLISRLEINSSIADSINDEEISNLVRSRQIIDENIAGNNYSALFNIIFAQDFVEDILAKKNINNLNKNALNNSTLNNKEMAALLIPIKIVEKQPLLWETNNDWKGTLERITQDRLIFKLKIPFGDLNDIATLNIDSIENYNYPQFEAALQKYHADFVYIAYFEFDNIENKVLVTLKTIRKFQNKKIKLSLLNVDRLDYVNLLNKVAQKTIEYLLNPQNFNPSSKLSSQNQTKLNLVILINNLEEWLVVKNKIESSNLINQLNIESISRDEIKVTVNYIAKDPDIVASFIKIGLFVSKKSDDSYLLSSKPFN